MSQRICNESTKPNGQTLAEQVAQCLRDNPRAMTMQIARDLRVPEVEVIRHLPDGQSVELDGTRWEEIVRAFEGMGKLHVISSNSAVTLECFGEFGNFSSWQGYFNVQTKTIDMHIRGTQIASVFAVKKKSHMDGVDTISVQFYSPEGASAFKVFFTFGGDAPSPERVAQFNSIVDRFANR